MSIVDFIEGTESAIERDRRTAGDIHEIEEWITEDNDNRSTRI